MKLQHGQYSGFAHRTADGWYIRVHGSSYSTTVQYGHHTTPHEAFAELVSDLNGPFEPPTKGVFIMRMPPSIHQAAREVAASQGLSLTKWVTQLIAEAAEQNDPRITALK